MGRLLGEFVLILRFAIQQAMDKIEKAYQIELNMIEPPDKSNHENVKKHTSILYKKRAPLIRRSDKEWLDIFKDLDLSGQTLMEFCRPRGMSPSSLCAKRKALIKKYSIMDIKSADFEMIFTQSHSSKENYGLDEKVPPVQSYVDLKQKIKDEIIPHEKSLPENFEKDLNYCELTNGAATLRIPMSGNPAWTAELIMQLIQRGFSYYQKRN